MRLKTGKGIGYHDGTENWRVDDEKTSRKLTSSLPMVTTYVEKEVQNRTETR